MSDVMERLWADAEPNFFGTRAAFEKQWEGWERVEAKDDEQIAFVAFVKGPLFHFHSFRTGKGLSSTRIKQFLQQIIDKHGYATTKTPLEDGRQQRFNRRIGFAEVGRDEYDVIYRIEAVGYRRY